HDGEQCSRTHLCGTRRQRRSAHGPLGAPEEGAATEGSPAALPDLRPHHPVRLRLPPLGSAADSAGRRRYGTGAGMSELHETAKALVAEGKGILAADESSGTIAKRFAAIGVESTEENRRTYRELLFTTPGAEAFISGVIMFDETIRQRSADGTPFPELLASRGIIPGIKVDRGAKPLALASGETVTEGLDGLRERLEEYRSLGARFAKWRGTYSIGGDRPSEYCVWVNAHALARYAALAQDAGLVPIVEPEVLMDGRHSVGESAKATGRAQQALFTE